MNIELSIVLPCYNESKNLTLLQNVIFEIVNNNNVEIILVNNGSTDNTEEVINEIVKQNSKVKKINIIKNIGYGNGIIEGVKNSNGKFISWTHSDAQSDLYDLIIGLNIIKYKRNPQDFFIMGSRYNRKFVDYFFTLGMSVFESILFTKVLYDISAQPKIMTREFFLKYRNPPKDFALDLFYYLMAKNDNKKIFKFSVELSERANGKSSWNSGFISRLRLIKRIILFSIRMRFFND